MNNLKEIVNSFDDIEYTKNLVTENDIQQLEEITESKFGEELKFYILNYGYLALNNIEFFGVNSKQMSKSDMIKTTTELHLNFDLTKNLVALIKSTDDIYYLVDEFDDVFRFDSYINTIEPLNIKLSTFIKNTLETNSFNF